MKQEIIPMQQKDISSDITGRKGRPYKLCQINYPKRLRRFTGTLLQREMIGEDPFPDIGQVMRL